MSALLVDYERDDRFALVDEHDGRLRWRVESVGGGMVRKGDWINGWFRGRGRGVLGIYWTRSGLWICDRDHAHPVDPRGSDCVRWRARGPVAELVVERSSRRLMAYRYVRTPRQLLLDREFPGHDLPRRIADLWETGPGAFDRYLRAGGLFAATWVDPQAEREEDVQTLPR